jgi:hypothetical protein
MIKKICFLVLLSLSNIVIAAQSEVRSTMQMTFHDKTFRIVGMMEGPIIFECVENCKRAIRYSDDPGGILIGVFSQTDVNNFVFTHWVSGTVHRTVIYNVEAESVVKVFDQYSLGAVDLLNIGVASPVVRARQYLTDTSKKTMIRNWQWNPKRNKFVQKI